MFIIGGSCNRGVVFCMAASLAYLFAAGSSSAGVPPPDPKDLTIGKWELRLDRSKFCDPSSAPQKAAREDVNVGWGLISVKVTITDAKGLPADAWYVYRYDGRKYPSVINEPASEYIIWKLVNPSRVVFAHYSKDDKVTQSYVRTVSPDGQTMTQTMRKAGQSCDDVQVFERR